MKRTHLPLVALAALLFFSTASAGFSNPLKTPDFTKGDPIPEGANHDWNLGATGLRGWMFSDNLVTTDARQIAITRVDKNSPADGVLAVGDVILGVHGKLFSHDPRTEFGKALGVAESAQGGGKLPLIVWRDGKQQSLELNLPVLGSYSATAPFDCPKSLRILELGCKALAQRIADPNYGQTQNPITRSLNALALLASGNPEYLPVVKKETEWASAYSAGSMQTWYYGYVIMLLAEYHMVTGDDSALPGLQRLTLEAAKGQSIVGSWGHEFARPDGRLGGYGMMNAPGVPLTTALVFAREAGVSDPAVSQAIERSARLLRFYIGKGAVPYGDHSPWIETHEDNGKCGMAAVLFNQLEEPQGAEFFSRMSIASHGSERDTGHTGNFGNILWSMPAIALAGPHATGAWMNEFGAWYFDLARRWDGSFPHQGPPQAGNDSTSGWDSTGGYLLAYAMPLKKILLTGKRPSIVPQLDPAAANQLIVDGRGWTNKDRHSAYDALNEDQLLAHLSSWSPIVRERAAIALSRRQGEPPITSLVSLLESPDLNSRVGACQALAALKERSEPAIDALRNTLKSDDLWLRIKAAEALSNIGKPAIKVVPELLELLTQVDTKNDPRGMQQRYLSSALFDYRGMLNGSLDGVDRELLYEAVRAGLKNEDGRARGAFGSVYRNLSYEEIKPLLPAIHQAIVEPAPSGIMFADGIRVEGLRILSTHKIEEGMRACVDYIRTQNPWASEKRTPELLEILLSYGTHAKPFIPELEAIAASIADGEPNFPVHLSKLKAKNIREAIATLNATTETPSLIRIQ